MDLPDSNDQENVLGMPSDSDSHSSSDIEDHNISSDESSSENDSDSHSSSDTEDHNISNDESPSEDTFVDIIGSPNDNDDGISNNRPKKRLKIKIGDLTLPSNSADLSAHLPPPPPAKRVNVTFPSPGSSSSQLPVTYHHHHQSSSSHNNEINTATETNRRCQHCQTMKTPQWRAGPMGEINLCNACGLMFKQEKLVPGYRPRKSKSKDRNE